MNTSSETQADAVARWVDGDTLDAIAADVGVSPNTVRNWCIAAQEIDVPPPGWRPPTVHDVAGHEPADGWMRDAACSGVTPVMFPGRGDSVLPAKAMCSRCPVIVDCATHAVRWNERQGVWGGLSEKQRRVYRQRIGRWKNCLECQNRFTPTHDAAAFCSAECRRVRHNRKDAESRRSKGHDRTVCAWCDEPITGGPYSAEGFCGWSCHRAADKARTREVLA